MQVKEKQVKEKARDGRSRAAIDATCTQRYDHRKRVSRSNSKIPRRPANRPGRTELPPRRQNRRERAALALLALAANLQQSRSLTPHDRRLGWAIFEQLLRHFVDLGCAARGTEAA